MTMRVDRFVASCVVVACLVGAAPVLMAGTNYATAPEAEGQETHHHEDSSPQKRPAPSTQNQHHDHNAPK